jgi:hypothetical protein
MTITPQSISLHDKLIVSRWSRNVLELDSSFIVFTDPCSEPNEISKTFFHHISLTLILLLRYHLHLDLPSGLFLSDFKIILEVKQV